MSALLEICQLTKRFDGLSALDGVDLMLEAGERRALIGPNGAGKTTLLNLIGGQLRADAGQILFRGRQIAHAPPHKRADWGIARTFQMSSAFPNLSVYENVLAAAQAGHGWLRYAPDARCRARQTLASLKLLDKADLPAIQLSHGERRTLEIGLSLASAPQLLLLDEPTAGLSIIETEQMVMWLQRLEGVALLIVEHDMDVVRTLANSITVLHHGRVLAEGSAAQIQANAEVQAIYLGEPHAEP
jgi:branched-chain amino acid transport system ATP-binding protein